MDILEYFQQKYPGVNFKHEPFKDCPRCHGKGEYINGLGKTGFCFCLFIEHDPELLELTREIFNDMAKSFNKKV